MPPSEPGWWYASDPSKARALLTPLADLYGWTVMRRLQRTQAYRSPLPVICVGNFTAGGAGKTPLALEIVRELQAMGQHPAVLTRGYGGRLRGPHWVDPAADRASDVGDEPLLLARAAPTLLARDRAAGARAVEARGHANIIVMDDGLQNPALAKDLTIAVVDGRRGFGNGAVIPAGPLRAPLAFQLDRVDAIVVNGGPLPDAEPATADIGEWLRNRFPGPVLSAAAAPCDAVDWLVGTRVLAYAGIGHPQRFFDLLAAHGAIVAATKPFPDHHVFTASDAARLIAEARADGLTLVTTEKDHARLTGQSGSLAGLAEASRTLPIRLAFDARDKGRLTALLAGLSAITRAPAAAPLGDA